MIRRAARRAGLKSLESEAPRGAAGGESPGASGPVELLGEPDRAGINQTAALNRLVAAVLVERDQRSG